MRGLVTAALAQLAGADVHLLTSVPGEHIVHEAFTELLTRPGLTADEVVAACYDATDPAPVRLPDAAVLASSSLSAWRVRPSAAVGRPACAERTGCAADGVRCAGGGRRRRRVPAGRSGPGAGTCGCRSRAPPSRPTTRWRPRSS